MSQPSNDNSFIDAEINKFIEHISEHCDSIVVFVTTPADGQRTESKVIGHGNWFAQYGHVRSWLLEMDQREKLGKKDCDETPE